MTRTTVTYQEDTVSRPDPRVPVSADNVVRVMQREIDRLKRIEEAALALLLAIDAAGPINTEAEALRAALEGAPDE